MTQTAWLRCWRLAAVCLLATSSALYVHYWAPDASGFCSVRSGCEAVRTSPLGYLGHRALSLPLLGLAFYGGLFLLSLRGHASPVSGSGSPKTGVGNAKAGPREGRLRQLLRAPAALLFLLCFLGAVGAIQLVLYQWLVVGEFCSLCLFVDAAAVLLALLSFLAARAKRRGTPRLSLAGWLGLGAIALASPPLWTVAQGQGQAVPHAIRALYVPGALNVVELSDFECPYCRKLHQILAPLLAAEHAAVNLRRIHVPLPQHPMAESAARAYLCAEAQGQGETMADLLFARPLSPDGLSRMAEALGLDPATYGPCLGSAATTQRLEQDQALAKHEVSLALPTTYIGERRIVGLASAAAFEEALEAARQPSRRNPGPILFWVGLCACIGLCLWSGRRSAANGIP